ncbi:E3 ubiquitin-protein ligase rnf168 [Neosynchiropus ocellatus]
MTDPRCPLALDDCVCPVCLEIFLEPVTLPCTHTFCKSCFLESVDKSTLCCPMCRKRVSTWVRHNSRNGTLVDQPLWEQIQSQFPDQCQRRQSGQDSAPLDHVMVFFPRVSEPGEVRQEYQEEVSRLREEQRQLDEEQRQASEAYICQLLQEEEQHLQEEQRRREADEQLARVISHQLVSVSSLRRPNGLLKGLLVLFLCPIPARPAVQTAGSTPKCSSHKENRLLSVLDHHGPEAVQAPFCHTQRPLLDRNHEVQNGERSKRKICEMESEEGTESGTKCNHQSGRAPSLPEVLAEQEAVLLRRRQQEEEDRRVAQLLQRKLDKELSATDRRKGSAGAYQLRRPARGKSSGSPPRLPAPQTQTNSRGGRQTTLTHLFPNLSS